MYNRNLRKLSPVKNIYKFISVKNDVVIMCESSLEFDTCFHLEYNPDVVCFKSQPTGFEYTLEGTPHRYTPGFLVSYYHSQANLLEIKPFDKTLSPEFKHEFKGKKQAAANLATLATEWPCSVTCLTTWVLNVFWKTFVAHGSSSGRGIVKQISV